MAIVELQVREAPFLTFLRTELDRKRLEAPTLPNVPGLRNKILQRIEYTDLTLQKSAFLNNVDVSATVHVHHNNSLAEIKAAGSMRRPATKQHKVPARLTVGIDLTESPDRPPPPWLRLMSTFPSFTGALPIGLPDDLDVAAAALGYDPGVLAVRLGTNEHDAVGASVIDRLEGHDWRQIVSGQVLADTVARVLDESVSGALSEEVQLDRPARGRWETYPVPHARATATIRVITPVLDVLVDLKLELLAVVEGQSLRLTARLSWSARTSVDLLVAVLVPYFGPKAMRAIFNAQVQRFLPGEIDGAGFEEVRRDDDSITFERTAAIATPSPHFALQVAEVTNEGVIAAGSVRLRQPRRGLEGEARAASFYLDPNCNARRVDVSYTPPKVHLRDMGSEGGAPHLFADRVTFEPADAWTVDTVPHTTWFEAALTFKDPPGGRLPAGTRTSAYLHTDCGVIWADLGRVPAEHPGPTIDDTAEMLSHCMAISDRWGDGVLNLGWLIDPPDVLQPEDLIRDWELNFTQLPPDAVITVVATQPGGAEPRVLSVLTGQRDALVHVITEPHEVVELRVEGEVDAPPPAVSQRWIEPILSVAIESDVTAVAVVGDLLGVRDVDGSVSIVDVGADEALHLREPAAPDLSAGTFERLQGALERQAHRIAGADTAVTTDLSRDTVALMRGNALLLGSTHGRVRL